MRGDTARDVILRAAKDLGGGRDGEALPQRRGGAVRQLLSLAVSALLLASIYSTLDLGGLRRVFAQASPVWLVVSIGAIAPVKLLQAWRLRRLVAGVAGPASLRFLAALRLILLADVMNLVLPSKAGDLAKSWFMRGREGMTGAQALSLVVFEKACDLLALLAWCAAGLLALEDKRPALVALTWGVLAALATGLLGLASRRFAGHAFGAAWTLAPPLRPRIERLAAAWIEVLHHFRARPARAAEIAALSLLLWGIQFEQVRLFAVAVGGRVPPLANLAVAPVAILAGLIPLTFAGFGTRDAAILALYRDWLPPATAAAVGILTGTRYLVPALAGLPLFARAFGRRVRESPASDAVDRRDRAVP